MTVRTTRPKVTFHAPFILDGMESPQPCGTYNVETDEELIQGLSFPVYKRIGMRLLLTNQQRPGVVEELVIDPAALTVALAKDSKDHV
jgi:hypothetical protein